MVVLYCLRRRKTKKKGRAREGIDEESLMKAKYKVEKKGLICYLLKFSDPFFFDFLYLQPWFSDFTILSGVLSFCSW